MSLSRFANTCSHLKNASHLRLGLTSIPYSKAQLSFCLLLLRQGFFSQVKVAGKAPPASCFPSGLGSSDVVSAHPTTQRDARSREAALTELVMKKRTLQDLASEGWPEESLEWAREQSTLSQEQLEADGWKDKLADFLMEHYYKTREQLEDEGIDEEGIRIIEQYDLPSEAEKVREEIEAQDAREVQEETKKEPRRPLAPSEIRAFIPIKLREKLFTLPIFTYENLAYMAGEHAVATPRHLLNNGITESAMGLLIKNQPFTPTVENFADPWGLEEEGVITMANRASRRLWVGLKYYDGAPVLQGAELVSKPKYRISLDVNGLRKVVRGQQSGKVKPLSRVGEIMAVHTNLGLLEARECVERNVGGQVIARVW